MAVVSVAVAGARLEMTDAGSGIDELVRPLSARSLVASALLGTHPPALPGALLVAFGGRFGIGGGTIRVALSRMAERGELTNRDGVYALAGDLLERQERQDRSRSRLQSTPWDGRWEQAVVTRSGRSAGDRNRLRRSLAALGLGEVREGVWMRPANLEPDRLPTTRAVVDEQAEWFTVVPIDHDSAVALAAELFDLEGWAATGVALQAALRRALAEIDLDNDALVSGFTVASATLRHLVHDPQLPAELAPRCWPAATLRRSYDDYERAYQQLLRRFFRSVEPDADP